MAVQAEELAAKALADWLRWKLSAKVTALNLLRAATLRAATPGPYVIPEFEGSSPSLRLSKTSRTTFTDVNLNATGSRTTAQVVTAINAGSLGAIASTDADDRLLLTSTAAPSGTTPSVIALGPEQSDPATGLATGLNAVFGWNPGGEHVVNVALVAPGWRGVCDGWPARPDMGPGFWVIIGNRSSAPVQPSVRRDEYLVGLDVAILYAPRQQETHRNREPIHACLRAVRECLLTDAGRQLGRASNGDIMLVSEKKAAVSGVPWEFTKKEAAINPIYDVANLQLEVRVFERPAAS